MVLQEIMKKKYLEHQTLGWRFICPIGPATEREFILDWRISTDLSLLKEFKKKTVLKIFVIFKKFLRYVA